MYRLFKGELKKIFLKPSLFIMTALLAIVITFSYYFYLPNGRTDTNVQIKGETVNEIYDKFTSGTDLYSKSYADNFLDNALTLIHSYSNSTAESDVVSPKNQILKSINLINQYTDTWNNKYVSITGNTTPVSLEPLREFGENLIEQIKNTQSYYEQISGFKNPIILQTVTDYSQIIDSFKVFAEKIENAIKINTRDSYKNLYEYIKTINILNSEHQFQFIATNYVDRINDVVVSAKLLESLKIDYYDVAKGRLNNINAEIVKINSSCDNEEKQLSAVNKKELNSQISFYNATCTQMVDILSTKLKLAIAESYTENEFTKFVNCSNFNRYEYTQTQTRQEFLFNKNKAEYDYATPLSFGNVSNYTPNAFDFTYYVLELFGFLIIVYCVVLGAGMIAGEQNNGTLKLLAIRPYARGKILFSKIFATMFFVIIFVLLSCIISMIAGSVLFGMESMPILLIYNATLPIVVSPTIALLLYLATLILKIFVYIVLAFALSTLFKSHIVATAVSILCLFVTSIFGIFLTKSTIFKYLPLNNLDLFKYFGGGRFPNDDVNVITSIFSSPILPDTTFMFSFTNICVTIALLLIITYEVFKHRDIA